MQKTERKEKGMCQRKYVQKLSEQRKTRKLFETLTFLEKQMEDESAVRDADTVLADILEGADFEITGIVTDLLKTYQGSKDRESVETCFEVLTGVTIQEYLKSVSSRFSVRKRRGFKSKKCMLYQGLHFYLGGKGWSKKEKFIFSLGRFRTMRKK